MEKSVFLLHTIAFARKDGLIHFDSNFIDLVHVRFPPVDCGFLNLFSNMNISIVFYGYFVSFVDDALLLYFKCGSFSNFLIKIVVNNIERIVRVQISQ